MSDFYDLKRQHEAAKKVNEERSQLYAMIGALASFEAEFGHLWGYGKDGSELTEEEITYREMWERARTEVLNKGNNQLRAAQDELGQYSLKFESYKEEFIVRKKDGNNG
jgi:hypothetical protein